MRRLMASLVAPLVILMFLWPGAAHAAPARFTCPSNNDLCFFDGTDWTGDEITLPVSAVGGGGAVWYGTVFNAPPLGAQGKNPGSVTNHTNSDLWMHNSQFNYSLCVTPGSRAILSHSYGKGMVVTTGYANNCDEGDPGRWGSAVRVHTTAANSCRKNQQEIGWTFNKRTTHGLVEITHCPVYYTRAYVTCQYHAEGGANTTKTFTGRTVREILVPSTTKCAKIFGTHRDFIAFGSEIHEVKNGKKYWGKCEIKPQEKRCT